MNDPVEEIRITNTFVREIVAREKVRRGLNNATSTAAQMLLERHAQIEQMLAAEALRQQPKARRTRRNVPQPA